MEEEIKAYCLRNTKIQNASTKIITQLNKNMNESMVINQKTLNEFFTIENKYKEKYQSFNNKTENKLSNNIENSGFFYSKNNNINFI